MRTIRFTPRTRGFHGVLLGVLALLASLLFTAGAASAGAVTAAAWATLPDSASMPSDSLIAAGTVHASSSSPVAGATMVLFAEPSNTSLAALGNGDSLDLTPVSRATTDTHGRFALRLPPTADLSVDASPAGDLNFVAYSMGANTSDPTYIANKIQTGAKAGPSARVRGQSVRLETAPAQTQNLDVRLSATSSRPQAIPASGGPPPPCVVTQVADLGLQWATVGQSFSSAGDVTIDFEYGRGQSSALGVGVSSTGGYGTFHVDGAHSVSTTATEGFPTQSGAVNRAYRSEFDFRKYYTSCFTGHAYSVQAAYWAGGTGLIAQNQPAAGFCVQQLHGSHFIQSTTSASTVDSGFAVAGAIGINLSSQTGFSATAALTFSFPGKGHPLCGVKAPPGKGAGQVTVHPGVIN